MAETKNLYQRLAAVYDDVEAIRKTGRNREQGYDFIEQAVIAGTIRQLLARHGLVLKTEIEGWDSSTIESKSGMKGEKIIMRLRFTLINIDTPTEREVYEGWPGEGTDYGDKAFNKASTIGQKYFLIRQFLISDKDPDEESTEAVKSQPAQAKPVQSAKAQPKPVEKQPDAVLTVPKITQKVFLDWLNQLEILPEQLAQLHGNKTIGEWAKQLESEGATDALRDILRWYIGFARDNDSNHCTNQQGEVCHWEWDEVKGLPVQVLAEVPF